MARPTKLTIEVQDRVVALIRAGNTVQVAAQAAGICRRTFHLWMARDDDPYRAFRAAVEQARADAEASLVARAARGNWRAAAFLLEQRFPERWAL
jgi:hypothetical protein